MWHPTFFVVLILTRFLNWVHLESPLILKYWFENAQTGMPPDSWAFESFLAALPLVFGETEHAYTATVYAGSSIYEVAVLLFMFGRDSPKTCGESSSKHLWIYLFISLLTLGHFTAELLVVPALALWFVFMRAEQQSLNAATDLALAFMLFFAPWCALLLPTYLWCRWRQKSDLVLNPIALLAKGLLVMVAARGFLFVFSDYFATTDVSFEGSFGPLIVLKHLAFNTGGEVAVFNGQAIWVDASSISYKILAAASYCALIFLFGRRVFANKRANSEFLAAAFGFPMIAGTLLFGQSMLNTSICILPFAVYWLSSADRLARATGVLFSVWLILESVFRVFFFTDILNTEMLAIVLFASKLVVGVGVAACVFQMVLPFERRLNTDLILAKLREPVHQINPERVMMGLIGVWVILACTTSVSSNDLWLHFKVGELIFGTKSFMSHEIFSATASGRDFLAHEWLSAVVFHWIHGSSSEGTAFTLLRVLVGFTIFWVLSRLIPDRYRSHPLPWVLLLTTLFLVVNRLHVRPHLFAQLFIAFLTFLLFSWRRHQGFRKLWVLVPLQILWANMHGSYLMGPALTGLFFGLVFLSNFVKTEIHQVKPFSSQELKGFFVFFGSLCAAVLVNPYGADLVFFSLQMFAGNDFFKQTVYEWLSPFRIQESKYWLTLWHIHLALLWFNLLRNLRKRPVVDLGVALVMTWMSCSAIRHISLFAIVTFPIVLKHTAIFLKDMRWSLRSTGVTAAVLGLLGFAIVLLADRGYPYSRESHRPLDSGFQEQPFLEEAVDFIKDQNLEGVVLNNYADGAKLIYELEPKVKVTMDSRVDLYGKELYEEYLNAFTARETLFLYLQRHRVNLILLRTQPELHDVFGWLEEDDRWTLGLANDRYRLFLKTVTPGNTP